jgi:hypothetical protein
LVCFEFLDVGFELLEVCFCELLFELFVLACLLFAELVELFVNLDFGDVDVLPTLHDVFG